MRERNRSWINISHFKPILKQLYRIFIRVSIHPSEVKGQQCPGCGRADPEHSLSEASVKNAAVVKLYLSKPCRVDDLAPVRHRQIGFCFYGDAKLEEGNLRQGLGVY